MKSGPEDKDAIGLLTLKEEKSEMLVGGGQWVPETSLLERSCVAVEAVGFLFICLFARGGSDELAG